MNPVHAARLRSAWPALTAVALGIVFLLVHTVGFQPLVARYHRALASAGPMGAVFEPEQATLPLPPRIYTLLMANSLPAAEADQKAQSGALGAEMVQALSSLAARHDLDVVVAEPGMLTPQAQTVEVRGHLRLRGTYRDFVAMVGEMATGGRLYALERFMITPAGGGRYDIELSVAGCVLKRQGGLR